MTIQEIERSFQVHQERMACIDETLAYLASQVKEHDRKLQIIEDNLIVQGNVSNELLQKGTPEQISQAIQRCFDQTQKRRHILNLNHGLLANTPFENVQFFIKEAKRLGQI